MRQREKSERAVNGFDKRDEQIPLYLYCVVVKKERKRNVLLPLPLLFTSLSLISHRDIKQQQKQSLSSKKHKSSGFKPGRFGRAAHISHFD